MVSDYHNRKQKPSAHTQQVLIIFYCPSKKYPFRDTIPLAAFCLVHSVYGDNIPTAEFGMIPTAETACWDIERK